MKDRSWKRFTIDALFVVLFIGFGAVSCTRETRESPATTTKRQPVVPRPNDDCPAFAHLADGTGALQLCSASGAASRQECPSPEQIVVLVDNDNETASRRLGRDVPATNWNDLLDELMAIGKTECAGGNRPLERLPGGCGTIQGAVNAWKLGACRSADGRLFPRFVTVGSGTTTPAAEAVQHIAREMTRAGSTPAVTFMAFDGIVDGDYRNAAARLAFADAVADAVTAGLKVWIVASPIEYRYVYLFARPQFETFAGNAARALAEVRASRGGTSTVAASLSESRYRDPGERVELAAVQVAKPPWRGVQWDFSGIALQHRVPAGDRRADMWTLDVNRWAAATPSPVPSGAAVRLSWNAEPSAWDTLVPFGLRLPPPAVLLNRPVSAAADEHANAAWVHGKNVDVAVLNDCPRRTARAPLSQGVSIAPGRADFLLVRGTAANAAWLSSGLPDWQGDPKKLRAAVVASAGPPLAAAMLVTPRVRPSRCTAVLLDDYSGSHRWGSAHKTPGLEQAASETDCNSEQWSALTESLRNVPYRRFAPGAANPWRPTDGRVAVETFLTVIERVARRTANDAGAAENPYACVLATFRIDSEASRPSDARWQQERLR